MTASPVELIRLTSRGQPMLTRAVAPPVALER